MKKLELKHYKDDENEIIFEDEDGNKMVFSDVKEWAMILFLIAVKNLVLYKKPFKSGEEVIDWFEKELVDKIKVIHEIIGTIH